MVKFSSFSELRTYLRKDRIENSLNPVRFVNVESMQMWIEVKKLLLSMSNDHLLLSEFCDTEDTTPNLRRLITRMKASTDSICVYPISEYLRINPEIAKSTIEEILSKEYPKALSSGLFRVYIPMYRMRSILFTIPDNDPRKRDSILLLETGDEIDYALTIIQKDLDVELSGNVIYGFQKYLQYWEQNPDKPLILHTSNAIYFENNVFFDDVKVIVTAFDLLRFHYSLPGLFQPSDGTDDYWNQLALVIVREKNFQDACCSVLSTNNFNIMLFEKWKTISNFQKWILWMWTRLQPEQTYLTDCAKEASSIDEFIECIFCNIINYVEQPSFSDVYVERRLLLAKMKLSAPQAYWKKIKGMSTIDAICVLTDLSSKEKETIFSLIQSINYEKKEEVIAVLRRSYPMLANYLLFDGEFEIDGFDTIHEEYFERYRWCKATNNLSEEFLRMVQNIAKEQGAPIYALNARNLVVNEEYGSESAILFVDGMGAEYIDYIASVLSRIDKEKYNIRYRVGYCNLPSTTEKNKDFLQGKKVLTEMLDLDELKHGSNQYPNNIILEMAFLDTLQERIENALDSGLSKVILTSDHGTSRLAVLIRETNFDLKLSAQGHSIYKYGRYCEGVDMAGDIPTAIQYDGKLIFADYTRFEQKGAPIDEIHGGASMEEWLVPVISIEKIKAKQKAILNRVILMSEEAKIDTFSRLVTIEFKLENFTRDVVSVVIHGKRIVCAKNDDSYAFKYRPVDGETAATATVLSNNTTIGEITFRIRRPLITNKKFDI